MRTVPMQGNEAFKVTGVFTHAGKIFVQAYGYKQNRIFVYEDGLSQDKKLGLS